MKRTIRKTRSRKRMLIPAGVLVGLIALGGGTAAHGALEGNDELTGKDLDRATSAATDEVGGGKVVSAEVSDDKGVAYEIEVRTANGKEVDVDLDDEYQVVQTERDEDERGDEQDHDDADERPLADAQRRSIEKAATDEAGGGTLTDAERSDDRGVAYEAEVRLDDDTEVEVDLDSDLRVVDSQKDDSDD